MFAGERASRGDAHAQELAVPTIHFEQFACAAINLLLQRGADEAVLLEGLRGVARDLIGKS